MRQVGPGAACWEPQAAGQAWLPPLPPSGALHKQLLPFGEDVGRNKAGSGQLEPLWARGVS